MLRRSLPSLIRSFISLITLSIPLITSSSDLVSMVGGSKVKGVFALASLDGVGSDALAVAEAASSASLAVVGVASSAVAVEAASLAVVVEGAAFFGVASGALVSFPEELPPKGNFQPKLKEEPPSLDLEPLVVVVVGEGGGLGPVGAVGFWTFGGVEGGATSFVSGANVTNKITVRLMFEHISFKQLHIF